MDLSDPSYCQTGTYFLLLHINFIRGSCSQSRWLSRDYQLFYFLQVCVDDFTHYDVIFGMDDDNMR